VSPYARVCFVVDHYEFSPDVLLYTMYAPLRLLT